MTNDVIRAARGRADHSCRARWSRRQRRRTCCSVIRVDRPVRLASRRDPESALHLQAGGRRSVHLPGRCSAARRPTPRETSRRIDAAGLEDAVRGSVVTIRLRPNPRFVTSIGGESPEWPRLPVLQLNVQQDDLFVHKKAAAWLVATSTSARRSCTFRQRNSPTGMATAWILASYSSRTAQI